MANSSQPVVNLEESDFSTSCTPRKVPDHGFDCGIHQNKRLDADSEVEDSDKKPPYVLTFGSHKGKTLSECSDQYVYIIHITARMPGYGINSPELRAGLEAYFDSDPTTHPEIMGWKPPDRETPSWFRERGSYTGRPLWISIGQAKTFFGLKHGYFSHDHLKPLDEENEKEEEEKRYWLYHIWDFVRAKDGYEKANAGLRKFKEKESTNFC